MKQRQKIQLRTRFVRSRARSTFPNGNSCRDEEELRYRAAVSYKLSRIAYELIILVRIGIEDRLLQCCPREKEGDRERKDLGGDFYDSKRAFGALQWCVQHKRKLPRKGLVFSSGAAI